MSKHTALEQQLLDQIKGLEISLKAANSVTRLMAVDNAEMEVKAATAERNNASNCLERAQLRLLLARIASRTGEDPMPLNAKAALRWFKKKGIDIE